MKNKRIKDYKNYLRKLEAYASKHPNENKENLTEDNLFTSHLIIPQARAKLRRLLVH